MCISEPVDWTYAQLELLEKQGVDLRKEMESKYVKQYLNLNYEEMNALFNIYMYSLQLYCFCAQMYSGEKIWK